jgi:hypothetical protein
LVGNSLPSNPPKTTNQGYIKELSTIIDLIHQSRPLLISKGIISSSIISNQSINQSINQLIMKDIILQGLLFQLILTSCRRLGVSYGATIAPDVVVVAAHTAATIPTTTTTTTSSSSSSSSTSISSKGERERGKTTRLNGKRKPRKENSLNHQSSFDKHLCVVH